MKKFFLNTLLLPLLVAACFSVACFLPQRVFNGFMFLTLIFIAITQALIFRMLYEDRKS